MWRKVLFGTDYLFTNVKVNASDAGLLKLNEAREGTAPLRLSIDEIDAVDLSRSAPAAIARFVFAK